MPPLQVIFQSESTALTGSLFLPERADRPTPGVVFLHGFTGSRMEPGYLFPRAARMLAAAGIASLTFDFRGSGESDGEFVDMTVPGEIKDANRALDFLKNTTGIDAARVGLLGYSLGGCVACHVLGERKDVRAAVLWAPSFYPLELAEARLSEHGVTVETVPEVVPVGNLLNGRAFFQTLRALDCEKAVGKSSAPILILHGEEDDVVPLVQSKRFVAAVRRAPKTVLSTVPKAGHGFDTVDAAAQLLEATAKWFKELLKG